MEFKEVSLKKLTESSELIKKSSLFVIILIVTLIYISLNISNNESSGANFSVSEELQTINSGTTPIINSLFDNTFYVTTLVETKLVDSSGNEKWAYSTMYNNPKTDFRGEYLAVWSDKSTSNIDVFNKKGYCYTVTNTNKVLDVDINKNGYLAVLVKNTASNGYIVNVYNDKGEHIVSRICDTENTFPTSVSIKDDNRIVALSELDTNYLLPRSYITFSYINQNDNKNNEIIFSGLTYKDELIAEVSFSKNYLIAYSKEHIYIIMVANDEVKEVSSISVNNEINFAQIIDDKYIAISLGSPLNSQATDSNVVEFYNFNGSLVSSTAIESKITIMTPAKNSVIIVSNRKTMKVNSNGDVDFIYLHGKDFNSAYYIGNKVPLIVVENDRIVSIANSKGN